MLQFCLTSILIAFLTCTRRNVQAGFYQPDYFLYNRNTAKKNLGWSLSGNGRIFSYGQMHFAWATYNSNDIYDETDEISLATEATFGTNSRITVEAGNETMVFGSTRRFEIYGHANIFNSTWKRSANFTPMSLLGLPEASVEFQKFRLKNDVLVVSGVRTLNNATQASGFAAVIERHGETWNGTNILEELDGSRDFGQGVAIANDGNTLYLGVPSKKLVRVFWRNSTHKVLWALRRTLYFRDLFGLSSCFNGVSFGKELRLVGSHLYVASPLGGYSGRAGEKRGVLHVLKLGVDGQPALISSVAGDTSDSELGTEISVSPPASDGVLYVFASTPGRGRGQGGVAVVEFHPESGSLQMKDVVVGFHTSYNDRMGPHA